MGLRKSRLDPARTAMAYECDAEYMTSSIELLTRLPAYVTAVLLDSRDLGEHTHSASEIEHGTCNTKECLCTILDLGSEPNCAVKQALLNANTPNLHSKSSKMFIFR